MIDPTKEQRRPARPLSPTRQRLVALFQDIHFGRLLDLHIRDGEPVFDPGEAPRVVRTVKLSGSISPRAAIDYGRSPLPRESQDLMNLLDRVGDGLLGRIEIAHGVPLFVEVHDPASAA